MLCFKCQVEFWLNDEFYRVAKQSAERFTWYCPNGHGQVFSSGQTEVDKLRQERDRLAQSVAQRDDEIREKQTEIERQQRLREATERRREPWLRCPSTHCERRGECGHPKDCDATKLPPPKLVVVKEPSP